MATQNVLQHLEVDLDRSPVCKRARYDLDTNDSARWTLTKNELILHSVYDSGVDRLDSDPETNFEVNMNGRRKKHTEVNSLYPTEKRETETEQIAVLEASLPENTLQKLSLGELDSVLLKHNTQPAFNNNINYFDLLSDEVILHIFQKLTKAQLGNVALVCKRFSQLAEDESLWTRMDVSNRTLEKGAVGIIISRQVIILRLAKSQIQFPPILPNVKAAQPDYRCRLMYLDLTMAAVCTKSLVMIFERCKRLKKISLESVPVDNNVLTALSGNKDLEVINLAMSTGIAYEGLQSLLVNCRNIRELNLSWTYLNAECIYYVCQNLPSTMDRLNFSGCRKILSDEDVATLVKNCCSLRELDLSDCTSITGESVRRITTLEDLNFLALSRCYAIPYRSLLLLKRIKSLTYLDVHGTYIDEDELREIREGLGVSVNINKFKFSSVARPTVGSRRSSIWNMRVRD